MSFKYRFVNYDSVWTVKGTYTVSEQSKGYSSFVKGQIYVFKSSVLK